jgi:exodeoxyribonuclease VII large subunit
MSTKEQAILSVSQVNVLAKDILESSFPSILVEGEISNLSTPRSGHVYFSLKDEKSQLRVALFAGQKNRLQFELEDGLKVLIKGNLSIFTSRGDLQLIAKTMEPAGEGELRRQFEVLKQKLSALGWFDDVHKQALPVFCKHLAVITSPSGAAIRDILHVLERRFPLLEITIIPSLVQGKEATRQLCKALEKANALQASGDDRFQFDLILLARGGGSLEDLWSFNEEALAKAVFESQLPIVSGVGHETDYTICDWVADYRAPTPSAAAESISQDQEAILAYLEETLEDLIQAIENTLQSASSTVHHLSKRCKNPRQKLQEMQQSLDFLEQALKQQIKFDLVKRTHELNDLSTRLQARTPDHRLLLLKQNLNNLKRQLTHAFTNQQKNNSEQLRYLAGQLNSLSPLNTVKRGYSISRVETADGKLSLIKDVKALKAGQHLKTQMSDGMIESTITSIQPERENS